MKLSNARICIECKEIFDHIKSLKSGKQFKVCPNPECGGTSTVMLNTYIETMAAKECDCEVTV